MGSPLLCQPSLQLMVKRSVVYLPDLAQVNMAALAYHLPVSVCDPFTLHGSDNCLVDTR